MSANKKVYYANSHGQMLESHLIGVALRAAQIFDAVGFIESKSSLRFQLVVASLFHDIGKLDLGFKEYIDNLVRKNKSGDEKFIDAESFRKKSTDASYSGPFHNEIGWVFSEQILKRFSDSDKDNIGYAIYWHHPANLNKIGDFSFTNAKKIYEKSRIHEMVGEDISQFINDLIIRAQQIELLDLQKVTHFFNSQFDIQKSPNGIEKPDFWQKQLDHSADKKLLLFLLIEADRWVSSISAEALEDFIIQPDKYNDLGRKSRNFKLAEVSEEDIRSQNQLRVVQQVNLKKPVAVCGIDPGEGKTRIGLRWWLQKTDRMLMIALPRQAQVTGLYNTVLKDLKDIIENSQAVKVVGFFNGVIQHDSAEAVDVSQTDIKILVFDRLLSPCYETSQVSEFVDMLFSDLVLDEFHEFMFIPKMIDSLKDILTIRSWLKNASTLLLSGTPELPLLKLIGLTESDNFLVSRESLEPHRPRYIELDYRDGMIDLKQVKSDSLVASLVVHDSQVNYKSHLQGEGTQKHPPYLIHSSFTAKDRKNKMESILEKFSNGDGCGIVYSARLLQSSFDLNFKHGYIALSVPSVDIQFLGRVNRYGNKDAEAKVVFYNDENRSNFFYDNNFGFSKLKDQWCEFLKNKILSNKGRKWKYREIINEIYEEFWKNEEIVKLAAETAERYRMEQEAYLKEWFPVRYVKNKIKKSDSTKIRKSKGTFREESFCASARVVDDNGEMISFLAEDDLLSVGSWKSRKLKDAIANQNAAALNMDSHEFFDFSKYDNSKKGLIATRPLFFSHPNENVNHDLKNGTLKDSKLYRVYHQDLGLCSAELLPLLRPDNSGTQPEGSENVNPDDSRGFEQHSDSQKAKSSSRKFTQLDENQILVPLSRRVPIFYTEYCKVVRSGSDVRILANRVESEFTIPVAGIGCLILGPGTSISAEAMRISTSRGCKILVAGGEASPLFLSSTQHRSPLSRLRQYRLITDQEKRLKAGKVLFQYRSAFLNKFGNESIPKFPDAYWADSIEKMLSLEGAWAKQSYKKLAQKYKTKWSSKKIADDKKHPIVFLNFLTYSIADIAILHLGYDPNVGVLHGRTKGGGLCYDLADVIKPVLALEGAFEAIANSYSLSEIKNKFMTKVRELDVLDYLVQALNATFKET